MNATARLRPESPFCGIFPDDQVPVRSFIPLRVYLEGLGSVLCFMVDGERVTLEQWGPLADCCVRQCGGTTDEFIAAMQAGAPLPVRESQTYGACSPGRVFW
ncbi:MAG: hypothetical protein QOE70_4347 [Chthoniobacter sp.]|jgi:hypothetical protein|nr:hypothetical protein [Chthoniobacter sp.]